MGATLTAELAARALAYAAAHKIASIGDIVTTTWGKGTRPRKVRVVSVGAHLIVDYVDGEWVIDFDMTYVAHRIRRDGSTAEREPSGGGICLDRLTTGDGREWRDRQLLSRNARNFNHNGLCWRLEEMPPADRMRQGQGGAS